LHACAAARVGRRTYYEWLKSDVTFVAARDEALEDAIDVADAELFRRAVKGVDESVFQGGEKVGTIRRFSDVCLTFYLKGRRPETYNRERHEHSGPQGGPIPIDLIASARESLAQKLTQLATRTQAPA
jgi:hypothetical protein